MTITEMQQGIPENRNFINRYFLLCRSYLWSASTFYDNIISQCPVCDCTNLHMIPICNNEVFALDYNTIKAFQLNFEAGHDGGDLV